MTRSKLAQLRELSVVVADTGDYDAIKRLRPVDCTTNPTLVKKALDLPVYAGLIERELQWGRAITGIRNRRPGSSYNIPWNRRPAR